MVVLINSFSATVLHQFAISQLAFTRQLKLLLDIDLEIRLRDFNQRNVYSAARPVVKNHFAIVNRDNPAAKVALTVHGRARFDLGLAAGKPLVISSFVKPALNAWRRASSTRARAKSATALCSCAAACAMSASLETT